MIKKVLGDITGRKQNQDPQQQSQRDDTKNALSKYFQEEDQKYRYMQTHKISEAVKTLIKRLKLLNLILSHQDRKYYDQNLIRMKQVQSPKKNQNSPKKLQKLQEYIKKLEQNKKENEQRIEEFKQQLETQSKQLKMLESEKEKEKIQQKVQLTVNYQKIISQLKQQLQNQEINQEKLQTRDNSNRIFMGQILSKEEDYQCYLQEVLQNLTRKKIKGAKMLYRWDPHNKANFHLYFDGHPNILLLILTKSQYHIAAFSEDPFSPNTTSTKQGYILSLTNRQCFKSIKRSIVYDPYHIIFGNSELRLGIEKKELFSNFGVLNAYYQGSGTSVSVLLGQGNQRTVEIQNYEILELLFK